MALRQAIHQCLDRTESQLDPNQTGKWFASRADYEHAVPTLEHDARYYREQLSGLPRRR